MDDFLATWGDAALTALGFFWMALWAFCLGYIVSSMVQVFITRTRMRRSMGDAGPRAIAMGAFFGFLSSSCSFAALSTTRALFQKGAAFAASLAFLLASTNLVIELGIVIVVFLSWHFVVAEYIGGVLLILFTWGLVSLLVPERVIEQAREHARTAARARSGNRDGDGDGDGDGPSDWRTLVRSRSAWTRVGRRYVMEWSMVWRDVLLGFTIAGAIATFVPPEFFRALFVGSGSESLAWWQVALHALIGPVAAFFTFIGSMGNIPLAAVLFGSGVSFAGVMAFIFSDLVVLPVLRIATGYFGWRMALTILGIFLASLVATAITLHSGFAVLGVLPEAVASGEERVDPADRFAADHTLLLNLVFIAATAAMLWLRNQPSEDMSAHDHQGQHDHHGHGGHGKTRSDWMHLGLNGLATLSIAWLAVGLMLEAWRSTGS